MCKIRVEEVGGGSGQEKREMKGRGKGDDWKAYTYPHANWFSFSENPEESS